MAEVEVDADVFYDLFLSFGFKNQSHQTGLGDKLCLPFRFIYAILVHVFGPLSSVAPNLPAWQGPRALPALFCVSARENGTGAMACAHCGSSRPQIAASALLTRAFV